MTKATIETRYEDCGFVYAGQTRMLFAPTHVVTRGDRDKADGSLAIATAINWPEPTKADVEAIIAALAERYPGRKLFADTSEGLVPVS
jgi:hypothetical protein